MQPMYAWVGQLPQGYRPNQVRTFAVAARRAALRAPIGATWRGGSSKQTAWIRYYSQMRDLVATLKAAGIEPWIVSASPKPFADVWGGGIGIDPEHTIGIEQIVRNGRLTTHLKGCGRSPTGATRSSRTSTASGASSTRSSWASAARRSSRRRRAVAR